MPRREKLMSRECDIDAQQKMEAAKILLDLDRQGLRVGAKLRQRFFPHHVVSDALGVGPTRSVNVTTGDISPTTHNACLDEITVTLIRKDDRFSGISKALKKDKYVQATIDVACYLRERFESELSGKCLSRMTEDEIDRLAKEAEQEFNSKTKRFRRVGDFWTPIGQILRTNGVWDDSNNRRDYYRYGRTILSLASSIDLQRHA